MKITHKLKKEPRKHKVGVTLMISIILTIGALAHVGGVQTLHATSMPSSNWSVVNQALSDLIVDTAQSNRHFFKVEIADTPAEQERGLMGRLALPPNQGMIFLFDGTRPVKMWMKNTYIALDMFFIDNNGTIVAIEENTVPLSTNQVGPDRPIQAVLELPAGSARNYKIKVGDRVFLPESGTVRY